MCEEGSAAQSTQQHNSTHLEDAGTQCSDLVVHQDWQELWELLRADLGSHECADSPGCHWCHGRAQGATADRLARQISSVCGPGRRQDA